MLAMSKIDLPTQEIDISFIIPAYNEEKYIVLVINSINDALKNLPFVYEIIVVDDFSSDNTVKIAQKTNAKIVKLENRVYPSMVRNIGATISSGKLLVFLDADVLLTREWGIELQKNYEEILNKPIITGSVCSIPQSASWVIRAWFGPILCKKRNYINCGNLVVSRSLFFQNSGFDKTLETCEDYDFCIRARNNHSVIIINNPKLMAIHLGYPETLRAFFNRERWHGKGNFGSVKMALTNKNSLIVLSLWVCMLLGMALLFSGMLWGILFFVFYLFSMSVLFALKRCGISHNIFPCIFLSHVWFVARCISLLDVSSKRKLFV